jgi:Cof subfamily protein (haloacid dehalogenase superfamily)
MNIKLIASDLDGTLLHNGAQEVSNEIITYIKELSSRGILFVAASGRQYANLRRLFSPVQDEIAYICENGALVMYQDQIISKSCIDRTTGLELMEDIMNKGDCELLLSGQATSYIQPKNPYFAYFLEHIVHNNVTVVEDFHTVEEPFYKISICEEAGIAENSGPYFINKWSSTLKTTISGFEWLDFTHPDTNKGHALQALCNHLHITTEQVMAFGDNYNDIEMLTTAKYGYVMEGAKEDIKRLTPFHTASVEQTIQKLLETL